ncbi:extracellular solute-binding protein [Paenibacillus silvisoli]|uniref:extracellular solute-binding protein n=1 Tax=Paenibacillus silvisoli TaxID=3110539 RepID=UPI002805477B|nr:extracellular solute-binding protein [Paenibacillus silvisoli]
MKSKLASLIVMLLITTNVAACSNSKNESASSGAGNSSPETSSTEQADPALDDWAPFSKYKEQIVFTTGRQVVTDNRLPAGDDLENNLFSRHVESKINVKVKNLWEVEANENTFNQKLSLSLSSGNLPDALLVDRKMFRQLLDADMIADLTQAYNKTASPYIKDVINSYGTLLDEVTVDGKIMAIPGANIGGGHNILWVRKDWLDKLGLQPPKTIDDIIAVAKAFIEKDPGGNGAGKTIGIPSNSNLVGHYNDGLILDPIFNLYGAFPTQWIKDTSGNIVYGSVQPEMKTALAKLAEMYKDGLIDEQFAIRKVEDSHALLASGKAGLYFGPWWAAYFPLQDSVKNNPKADWKPYNAPLDADGKYNTYKQDMLAPMLVVRKGFEHPEAIVKVLNVELQATRGSDDPDGLKVSKEMQDKGINWAVMPLPIHMDYNDALVRSYNQLKEAIDTGSDAKVSSDFKSVYPNYVKNQANPGADAGAWADATARIDGQALTFNDQVVFHDVAFHGVTPSMETKWANLEKLENQTLLKIVMGEIPVDDFDQFVEEWKRLGGDEITKEVNDSKR